MFQINSDFIGKFIIGDNVQYSVKLLPELYVMKDKDKNNLKCIHIKIIIILMASILEALIYDYLLRIKYNTIEGVKTLDNKIIEDIRAKKIKDQFSGIIKLSKDAKLFDEIGLDIYKELYLLKDFRNRLHIQNVDNKHADPRAIKEKEPDVFTEENLKTTEKTFEKIVKFLQNHLRDNEGAKYSNNNGESFSFPWNEHYSKSFYR